MSEQNKDKKLKKFSATRQSHGGKFKIHTKIDNIPILLLDGENELD